MYQALVRHFELFNNLPQPEFYYCRKNVWSYNIKINSLWQWVVGREEPLREVWVGENRGHQEYFWNVIVFQENSQSGMRNLNCKQGHY